MVQGARAPAVVPSGHASFTTKLLLAIGTILATAHCRASDTELADTAAVDFQLDERPQDVRVGLCPTGRWSGTVELWSAPDSTIEPESRMLHQRRVDLSPDRQFVGAVVHVHLGVDALSQIRLHLESDDGKWYTLLPEIVRRHE